MLEAHSHGISDFEQILGKLADRELLLVVDHLPVSLHGALILLNLLCVFNSHELDLFELSNFLSLQLFELLLETLDLCLLLVEQLLDLLDVFL